MQSLRWALAPFVCLAAALAWFVSPEPPRPLDAADRLAGRVLMVGFDGREPTSPGVARTLTQIGEGRIAGVMYLRRNVADGPQVRRLNAAFAAAAPRLPPLVALDQEGGRVSRLGWRSRFPRTPSAFAVAKRATPGEARTIYGRMARGLRDWGFNVNLGPVVDVHRADNPIIGRLGRAFAERPETIVAYARAFQRAHSEVGVATALKHFPGHGSSLADTHLAAVDVTGTWHVRELDPYRPLLTEAPLVMTGHVINRRLGGPEPATLSHAIVTGLLRERLGYRGVVVSDDLQMDAIGEREEIAAEKAMRAGVDLLLFANDGRVGADLVERVVAHLAETARRDPRFETRLREAGDRIESLRERLVRCRSQSSTSCASSAKPDSSISQISARRNVRSSTRR